MTNLDWNAFNDAAIASYRHATANSEILEAHRFSRPFDLNGREGCKCGWRGTSWADHLDEQLNPKPVVEEVAEEVKPRRRKAKATD